MSDRLKMYPATLSGGEKQRVAIARAWVSLPKVIIADEPTGQLDSTSTQIVVDLFKKINQENNTAIIIASHDPGALSICNRVIELTDGEVVLSTS